MWVFIVLLLVCARGFWTKEMCESCCQENRCIILPEVTEIDVYIMNAKVRQMLAFINVSVSAFHASWSVECQHECQLDSTLSLAPKCKCRNVFSCRHTALLLQGGNGYEAMSTLLHL